MTFVVAEAMYYLLKTEWNLRRHQDRPLYRSLKPSGSVTNFKSTKPPDELCRAVDIACLLYWRRVMCLQRSVATAMLLRRYGFRAEVVIGARSIPFRSHAWVELDRRVINDRAYTPGLYQELERC
jgi:prolyl oligopeptidase